MKYQAILFDIDGTLVPMTTEAFTKGYFKLLAAKVAHLVPDPQLLVQAVWQGTAAMSRNNGSCTNADAFWSTFTALTGVPRAETEPLCLDFYTHEFHEAKRFTGENPLAQQAVRLARQKAEKVVLASNPVFPRCGQLSRAGWVGLEEKDFDYLTSYEDQRYCKPSPQYYEGICRTLGLEPAACLMVGNDEFEDAYNASLAGMDCWLITDCLIPCPEHPWAGRRGTFAELVAMLETL